MPELKKIKVNDAVGTVLAHDMTQIVRGEFKGAAFKKGHKITPQDIPLLLKMGKQYIYGLELGADHLHEDDAAGRIAAAIADPALEFSEPREGKINIITRTAGLLKINIDALMAVNRLDQIIVATLKNNFPCEKGQVIAGTRIIPLTIETEKIEALESLVRDRETVLTVKPYVPMTVGAVVTGSEVYNGLITDDFNPTIGKKISDAGCTLKKKITVPDNTDMISGAVKELEEMGCELIITTGGLSVDPDDVTRQGVLKAGAEEIFYGSPVLPGAMLMVSTYKNSCIVSLPACVFYYKRTVFDLILPRILSKETITKESITAMGHGGLCLNCETCHYPACSFGR